jgi:hypothetical protein
MRHAQTRCGLCGEQLGRRQVVHPGPELGPCHRACFNRYDDDDERDTLERHHHATWSPGTEEEGHPMKPIESVPSRSIRTDERELRHIATELAAALKDLGIEPDEYGPNPQLTFEDEDGRLHRSPNRLWPAGYRWIACYPVTGGSEGYYVHVDRVFATKDGHWAHETLILSKCWSFDLACKIAHACAWLLHGV